MKNIFLALLLFFFLGCDGKIVKNIYDKSKLGVTIKEIEIAATDRFSYEISKKFLKEEGFLIGESPYKIRVEYRNYAQTCNNPLAKTSSDYAYDGFVKITLFYKGSRIYASQRDFKGEISEKLIISLIEGMIDDVEIKR